ncbi:hypothetical protein [Cellvibrio sp. pealriver]|uniref:hypothetical protein n=1 Tax=Cellvibrio sp. pealriver TaxID=1622269 RepID=UPI00066FFB05|nr:hypothetical protein [Cellvibrio sp. pealriver]
MHKRTSKYFDPDKSFFNLFIVRLFIGALAAASIAVTIIIIKNSNLEADYSYKGINQLLTVFKVPLSILATLIPILAVFAANHISEQSKESNRLSKEQNTFSNYYSHIEFFTKYMDAYQSNRVININSRKLHNLLFPLAKHGDYRISASEISKTMKVIIALIKPIKLYEKNHSVKNLESVKEKMLTSGTEIFLRLTDFAEENMFDETKVSIKSRLTSEQFADTFLVPLDSAWKLTSLLLYACSFDPHYDLSRLKKLEDAFSTIMNSNEEVLRNMNATQKHIACKLG